MTQYNTRWREPPSVLSISERSYWVTLSAFCWIVTSRRCAWFRVYLVGVTGWWRWDSLVRSNDTRLVDSNIIRHYTRLRSSLTHSDTLCDLVVDVGWCAADLLCLACGSECDRPWSSGTVLSPSGAEHAVDVCSWTEDVLCAVQCSVNHVISLWYASSITRFTRLRATSAVFDTLRHTRGFPPMCCYVSIHINVLQDVHYSVDFHSILHPHETTLLISTLHLL